MLNFTAAGLNLKEAKCYSALLQRKDWRPADLAKNVKETRTNCYKILDKLVEFGLAERFDHDKKLHYRATNPSRLLQLAREQKVIQEKSERALESGVEEMLGVYYKTNEQPGVRYFQGKGELKDVYMDQIKTNQPIYIIRPDYNMDLYDFEYMTEIRHLARKAGIPRYAITPDRIKAPKNYKQSDPYMLLDRTWLPANEYTAAVEWNVYGDKLAIMSFGNEAIGLIIESPQIAESFKQFYRIMEQGLKNRPNYDQLPKYAQYIGATAEKP